MTEPATYKINIYQGATYHRIFTWTAPDPDDPETQVPVDLTGATARLQVRKSFSSDIVLLEATTEDGRITLGGPEGTIELVWPDEVTAAIGWRAGRYDLEIESAGGEVTRLLQGAVKIYPEVTR